MINNYYDAIATLGVAEGASREEIKEAFWDLSKKYHPDLYKEDNGESFIKINQAYQFLKKEPDPPNKANSTYQYKKNYASHDYSIKTERERRTARNRARIIKEEKEKAPYYAKVFNKLSLFIKIILILNCVLALDYMLPSIKHTTKIQSPEFVSILLKQKEQSIRLNFQNGGHIFLHSRKLPAKSLENTFTYEKSLILRKQLRLTDETIKLDIPIGFNIYRSFAFIIIIQLLALWRYYVVKDRYVKLNAIIVMAFCLLFQLPLIFLP